MLGWKITKNGEYVLGLPVLSKEEENILNKIKENVDSSKSNLTKEALLETTSKWLSNNHIYADKNQMDYLCNILEMEFFGFGFLSELLKDDKIEEISIIGPNKPCYIYLRNEGWKTVNAEFTTHESIVNMVNVLSKKLGRRITIQTPKLDAILPDGSRLHASMPPISDGEITIRKFREKPFSPSEIAQNSTIELEDLTYLSFFMQGDYSLLVAGNTASGKTTTLNSLFSFVPMNERVLITEETPEINIPHEHKIRLISNRQMQVNLSDLVYDSLRMRPDRTIVGEVRNKEEVQALFDIMLGGQSRGCYATFHARSAAEALNRLKYLGIPESDLNSIDLIIVQRRSVRYDSKLRKNYEIRKVSEITDSNLNSFKKSDLIGRVIEDLNFSKKEFLMEFATRKKLISKKYENYYSCFASIQKNLYGFDYASKND